MRVSKTPILFNCAQSRHAPQIVMHSDDKSARLGSGTHEHQAEVVKSGLKSPTNLEAIGKKWRLDEAQMDDLEFLCWRGIEMWKKMSAEIQPTGVEVPLKAFDGELELTGTADLIGKAMPSPDIMVICDWKSGYNKADEAIQVRGYGSLAWLNSELKPEKIICMVAYLRDGTISAEEMTGNDVDVWVNQYIEQMQSNAYRIGDHCQYCPRNMECVALQESRKNSIVLFGEQLPESAEKLAELYPKAKALKAVLEQYDSAIRSLVAASPDGILLEDGTRLVMETNTKQTITGSAIDLIQNVEGYQDAVSVSKTKLLELASAKAAKGQKKKACEELMKTLAEAGCVKTSEYSILKTKKEKA